MTEILANLQPFLAYLERVSRSRGARLILSRTSASTIGESAAYTRRKGLDQDEGKLLLHKRLVQKGDQGATLEELAQVLPSKTRRQIQHLLWLLADEHKAVPPRRGRRALWKSESSEFTGAFGELNTNSDCV
jgi:ATP-dependent DNA helicase RecG